MGLPLNNSIEVLQPLTEGMNSIMNRLEILVGGVFGLYVLFFLYKIYSEARLRKTLKDIKKRLIVIEKKVKIKHPKKKK